MIRSRDTTSFAFSSSRASNARCCGDPSATGAPSESTSSGPSSLNSILPSGAMGTLRVTLARRWASFTPMAEPRPGAEITPEELQLAARNHGTPLEALRHEITPPGLHYLLTHYDVPAVDP